MSNLLPEGWATIALGEACAAVQYGYTASANEEPRGPRFLRITDIQDGRVDWSAVPSCDIDERSLRKFALASGDIVFARSGATTGKSFLIRKCPRNAIFASYLIRVRPLESLDARFLSYYFQTPTYWDYISENVSGNAQPNCNASKLSALPLLVPPLAEQLRIVAKVEALLDKVNAARERLGRVPTILKRFRQAILAAACSGRLTEDWRGDHSVAVAASKLVEVLRHSHQPYGTGQRGNSATPSDEAHDLDASALPVPWVVSELQWLCEPGRPITYGILKPGPDHPDGVPYVRVADFPSETINLSTIRRTSPRIAQEYRRSTLRAGDVLLSIRGTFGRVSRVPRDLDGGNITQDTARLTVDASINAEYLALYLMCPSAQDRMRRAAKGVAVRGVNIGDVRALQVAVPPRDEQDEIVRRVNSLLRLAEGIERRVRTATKRVHGLPQTVLARAFRGELVPTEAGLAREAGRDYEPASVLLERIGNGRATRAVGGQKNLNRPLRPSE